MNGDLALHVEDALRARGSRETPRGFRYRCFLEGHEDKHPSAEWDSTKTVWHCPVCNQGGGFVEAAKILGLLTSNGTSAPEAVYAYTDEGGDLLFEVVRFPTKKFRVRRYVNGLEVWSLQDSRRVLYRLPALIAALAEGRTVWIAEGEKDADSLVSAGEVATCNVFGAGKWRDEYSETFRGTASEVVIVADRDTVGMNHAAQVFESLRSVGVEARVVQAKYGKDATDHLLAGHGVEDFEGFDHFSVTRLHPEGKHVTEKERNVSEFKLTPVGELLAEPVETRNYVVDRLFPVGGLSILVSKPKVGKSTLARTLCRCVARGDDFLGRSTLRGRVLLFQAEGSRAELAESLRRLGVTDTDDILAHTGPDGSWPDFVAKIREYRPALVVVDTLFRLAGVDARDVNDYAEIVKLMGRFEAVSRETGAHICCLHHANKSGEYLGSTGIFGAVDTALSIRKAEAGRVLSTVGIRYGDELQDTVLDFDPETEFVSAGGELRDVKRKEARVAIIGLLHSDPKTEKDLREAVGIDQRVTSDALRELVEAHDVIREGRGVRNDPYTYRLPDDSYDSEAGYAAVPS